MTEDRVQSTRATYDEIADDYTGRKDVGSRDWLDEILVGAAAGGLIIDLGCGPGFEARVMQGDGYRVVGLDLSTSMLQLARQAGVPGVQADLRRLPFADESADAVFSSASLLHVPREDTVPTLAEWRRVTRRGGLLALSTSNGEDEGWEVVPYAPPPEGEPDRRRWFVHRTRDELVDALHDAGWRVEHVGARESHRRWHLVRARA